MGTVNGTETAPDKGETDHCSKFLARWDRALATIVLAVEPSLLYLIGEPEDPVVVWKKLQYQFQKKTQANKLALRLRLHFLQLKYGKLVQGHIKAMMELFNELAVVRDVIQDEDHVIYLLASLPDSLVHWLLLLKLMKKFQRWRLLLKGSCMKGGSRRRKIILISVQKRQ